MGLMCLQQGQRVHRQIFVLDNTVEDMIGSGALTGMHACVYTGNTDYSRIAVAFLSGVFCAFSGWIAMKFDEDIHDAQMINPHDFGHPLTF